MGSQYFCKSCHYKWQSKKSFGEPSICPHCKKTNIVEYSKTKEYAKMQEEAKVREKKDKEDIKKYEEWKEKLVVKDMPLRTIWYSVFMLSFGSMFYFFWNVNFLELLFSIIILIFSFFMIVNRTNNLVYKHAKGKNLEMLHRFEDGEFFLKGY